MAVENLKALNTALVDTKNGYTEAVNDAEPSAARIFREMLLIHGRDHEEVHAALVAAGEKPDEAGSFMSTVHETVIKVRSAVTGLGTNAISAFTSGEEMLLEKYDDALAEADGDASLRAMLTKQRTTLASKIAEMKALET